VTRPRLIATDLDGTFLRPDGTVSAINASAVARAAELEVPFVIATGRPTRWLGVLDALSTAHPQVIVSNGGAVVDLATRRPIHQFPLTPELVLQVAQDLRAAIPGITFGFETGVGFGCEPDSPSLQRLEPGHHTGSLDDLATSIGTVIKLLGFHAGITSEQLTALASDVVSERLNLTHSSVSQPYGMIELTAPGVSKASTLELLCTELGIAASEVVAFGDMPNDLEMLTWVGQGFVVANGHDTMKGCGFIEVPANAEDGVGLTILELLA
jgi:Cof subfamily protein (haloacid dehalogenase superfamily)